MRIFICYGQETSKNEKVPPFDVLWVSLNSFGMQFRHPGAGQIFIFIKINDCKMVGLSIFQSLNGSGISQT
jgi:hypothetical protein